MALRFAPFMKEIVMEKDYETEEELTEEERQIRKKIKRTDILMVILISIAFTDAMMRFDPMKIPDNIVIQFILGVLLFGSFIGGALAFLFTRGDISNYFEKKITKEELKKNLIIHNVAVIIAVYVLTAVINITG